MNNIKEGDKVQIRGQKGQYVYEVDMLAPVAKLAKLKGFGRVVAINRLVKVA